MSGPERGRRWPRSLGLPHQIAAALVLASAALSATACRLDRSPVTSALTEFAGTPKKNLTRERVADYREGVDYFPDKTSFSHSRQLRVSYHGHYKLLSIVTEGLGERLRYALVQKGAPTPELPPGVPVFQVPIERFSLGSFRYGGAADRLGVLDRLVGFGNAKHATVPGIRERFESGLFTRNYSTEAIVQREPEVHLDWYAHPEINRSAESMARMGVPVIPGVEHREETPLGRAEWIKFLALFFNKEAEANEEFARIERDYREAAALAADLPSRPRVLLNLPRGDRWQAAGGRNLFARMIADAGGSYVFDDNRSVDSGASIPYELALDRGLDADVWVITADLTFGGEMAARSDQYRAFRSIRSGRVFLAHANYPDGPNPWWDMSLIRPGDELKDLIAMFHPERLTGRRMSFYIPLPRKGA